MKSRIIILTLTLIAIFSMFSCASHEDSEFFEPTKSDEYQLDIFSGNTDFLLPDIFNIDNTLINRISFTSFDGSSEATIHGLYIGDLSEASNRKIVVYSHDKSGNLDNYWPRIKLLANLGLDEYHILAIDYRGYGKSSGTPSEEAFYADTNAALQWLKDTHQVIDEQIVLYGFGLGSSAAIELAGTPRSLEAQKLIIEAPLASIESLLQEDLLQSIPSKYLTDLSFNNVDKIKRVSQPTLWLHGSNDKVYDSQTQGQLVFNAHPGSSGTDKHKLIIDNADHSNIPEKIQNGFDGYLLQIRSFLESN